MGKIDSLKKKINVTLNKTLRLVTGCLRNTEVVEMYCLVAIRRSEKTDWEKTKIKKDHRDPMYAVETGNFRLKSI